VQCIDLLPELPVAISEEERYSISDLDSELKIAFHRESLSVGLFLRFQAVFQDFLLKAD